MVVASSKFGTSLDLHHGIMRRMVGRGFSAFVLATIGLIIGAERRVPH